jgi:hypothetical protein
MNGDGAGTALQQLMISAGIAVFEGKISPIWRLMTMNCIKRLQRKNKIRKISVFIDQNK